MPALLTLIAVGALACADSSPVAPPLDAPARFQKILEDSARANGVIGAQAVVLIPGRPAWSGVTGEDRPGVRMTADEMIGTGSISKLYTAVAAMILIDRGKFTLDDVVGRWFTGGLTNIAPGITVRQMLRHTSGLADYSSGENYSQTVFADRNRSWTPMELLSFVGPPRFAPDQGWEASNTNRLLLNMIVERESGMSLGAFMRREIFAGLHSSWLFGDGPTPSNLATQWFVDAEGKRTNMNETLFGPALFTARLEVQASAGDIAAFGKRLLDGDLLSDTMRKEMLTIVPDDGKIPVQTGGGLGIRRYSYLGRTMYGHSGATSNGTCLFIFDPATRIIVAMSVNQNGPSHQQSHFRTVPALMQAALEEVGH